MESDDPMSDLKSNLLAAIREFEIIDCHEHLELEPARTSVPVDALNLFSHYCSTDLVTAGMGWDDYPRLFDPDLPLDERWSLLRPFLPEIRFGSYARAAWIAAQELYGFEDINDETYEPLSAAMQARNVPGVYQWILREHCHIRHSLTQNSADEGDGDLLVPVMWGIHLYQLQTWADLGKNTERYAPGTAVNTLEEYLDLLESALVAGKAKGAVGIKIMTQPFPEPERSAAEAGWSSLRAGSELPLAHPLHAYLLDELIQIAARLDLVVAIHSGLWGDFRRLDATHMIPFFIRHPEARFDLYHLSFPQMPEAVVIGKNFPNVWLNLCWTHIMSPTLTREGIRLLLDLVPVNKVFAFGGDYAPNSVDKAVGHLRLAQDNIATVFAERVAAGLMTEEPALSVAHKWFWDNPIQAYGLKVESG